MFTSTFPEESMSNARVEYADMDMVIKYYISHNADVCVFHDKPFSKTLSWFEYDAKTSRLDFILEDGDVRNFGIPVDPRLKPYFQNAHVVSVIQVNENTKKVEQGIDLPLILHAA